MMRCVLVLLLSHVLLLSATPESLFFPHLSPSANSDSPILFGLGTDNDGGCLLQVNQSTGEATCWLNQCPVGANCLAADAMEPAYAQAVPGSTQIFEWGYGPCCNTDYSAYLIVDVESKEINGIYQITSAEISAAAPAGPNKYWAAIQQTNAVSSRDFEIVQLGLDKSDTYEILAKFPDSPIIPGAYTTPGMFVDNVRNRVIVMGQLENGETGGMIINITDWSLINTVPYGTNFLPKIVSYDDTTDTMVALDFQDFGNTVKYIAWPPDTQPDLQKESLFCKDQDCDFSGCTIQPGTTEMYCVGVVSSNCILAPLQVRSVDYKTHKVHTPDSICNSPTFRYLAFVDAAPPAITCNVNKCQED